MKKVFFIVCLFSSINCLAGLIYIPEKFNPQTAEVVLVLHGCLQSAESMAAGTNWNELADKENLLIIYPQVTKDSHPINCWSWYLPENQSVNSGQLKSIVDEVKLHLSHLQLKKPNIYVTGISSGAAMVTQLIACYPKMFKAAAPHSGPAYGFATNLKDAEELLKKGPTEKQELKNTVCDVKAFKGPLLIIHGESDNVVHINNAKKLVTQFSNAELKIIPGLGHAWSGSRFDQRNSKLIPKKLQSDIAFFDKKGPNSTQIIWDFFKKTK